MPTQPLQNHLLKVALTAAAEVVHTVAVTGQVTDGEGNSIPGIRQVLFRAFGLVDADITLDVTTGTKLYAVTPAKGEAICRLKTDKNGKFVAAVTSAGGGTTAVAHAELDGGVPSFLDLIFAA